MKSNTQAHKQKGPWPLRSLQYLTGLLFSVTLVILSQSSALAAEIKLPILGDATSGIVSKQQEYELGRTWLKAFRSRVREHDDPLMQQYLEQLLYNLATYSDVEDPRLELVIINNPSMNAFAVPGGVVGFHTGVFALAENEDQMASVLAHELAHLSQRHFARGVEAQRASSMLSLGGLLASLVIAATAGGDAGMAAITATQAVAMNDQLRYSRSNEQEADRMGLQTMERANRDPGAVADMFATLLKATRYKGSRPPEFLLTHPVTEKRIADARGRAMASSMRQYSRSPEFHLIKARALVAISNNPKNAIKRFNAQLRSNPQNPQGAQYGLALAYIGAGEFDLARQSLARLLKDNPYQLSFQYADLELDIATKEYNQGLAKLDKLLRLSPNNYPLTTIKSEILWQAHRYEEAGEVLTALSRMRPEDPMIWYRLAEVRGLAGNISGVHEARAEYFILVGAFDQAREQLSLAVKLVASDFKRSAIVRQRIRDVAALEDRIKKL
ncbi:M48 family metalloprotease [Porticoccaceae bacterium]|nr:M48 family metalloprotease [Porticoccaceae bacterium]CAI8260289.1 MAG: Beta-barrel assembly-enhancing protease [SAR92 bacterium MED-G29]